MSDTGAPVSGAAAPVQGGNTGNQDNQSQNQANGQEQKVSSTPAQQPKSWKAKVDGKEVTWESEEQLLSDAGKGKAAFERMRQAAELTKKTQEFLNKFKQDPMAALEDPTLGLDEAKRRELIEKYYQKKYLETDNLSPEQKRIMELEKRIQEREEADRQAEEAQKTEKQKALDNQWRDTFQSQIITAIEKGGLPKNPRTAARVASVIADAIEAGYEMPLHEIVAKVGEELTGDLQHALADEVPMDIILKVLPPNFLKRLRAHDIEQYKSRQQKGTQPPTETRQPKQKSEERMTYADVLKKFG